jgi:SAM-dependent methyltransferase
MSEIVCNLCGSRDARVLFRKDSTDFFRCRQCGLEWIHPLPDMEKMRELYSSPKYYNTDNISQYGYSEYVRNKHLYVNLFNRRLDELLLYTNGVDISEYATNIARAYYCLDVFTGELADAAYHDGQFDVVVMDDLIEHVADPTALVRESRRILKPGGLLTLNTPNRAGLWHLFMGRRWFHYRQVEHTFFFSPAVMTDLLERNGFNVLEIHSSSKIIDLNYAFGRLRYYNMAVSNLFSRTVGRLLISSVTFPIRVGEMVVFARKG